MANDTELLAKLKEPFDPKFVKWRVGATTADKSKGIALAYIDAREVMKRLDDVFGVTGWQSRFSHVTERMVTCEIGAKVNNEWVWKSDGAGDTAVEAEKGSLSDALKRTAVLWGIGRYLYYLPNEWVELVPAGKSHKLKNTPTLPKWALPKEQN